MIGERLLERAGEREALVAALGSAAAGRGRLVVLEGEAGRGKTSLLALAGELAAGQQARVLSAHGGVLERDVGWGLVRQLLEPVVFGPGRIAGLLDGAARAAQPVLGPMSTDAVPPPDGDATPAALHGLFRVIARLAETRLVLLAVDDAHWADEASLRWLVYLGRRVERLRIVVAVARRLGEPSAHDALLDELSAVRGAVVQAPRPLSAAAVDVLAAEAFGAAADRAFTRACLEATGGNAFLLVELVRALAADGARPSAQTGREVRALRPPAVVADVRRRLARLAPEAADMARALAVLDGEAELRHVIALARLPAAAGEAATDELTLARLLAPGRPVRFAHPILRAAVEAELPPAGRAAAHRRAATVLDGEPGMADRAAAHLLVCEPAGDPWVAQRLQAAAGRAMARGAPETAVRLLERALREPDDSWPVRLALGRAHRLGGRLGPAAAELGVALSGCPVGPDRAQIARELATALALSARGEEAVALLERETAALPSGAPERRRLASSALALQMTVDALVAGAAARVEGEAARVGGDAPGAAVLQGALAMTRARTGTGGAVETAEIAERALAQGTLLSDQNPEAPMSVFVALVLLLADRDADAEHWLERLVDDAAGRGAELTLSLAEMGLARVRVFRGELVAAETLARRAVERALLGSSYGLLTTVGTLTDILVERGELQEADRLLGDLELDGTELPEVGGATTLLRGRMRLRSAQGRNAAARADADELLARLERRGHCGPGPLGEVALMLLAAGDAERARPLAELELERAQRWGTAGAIGVARRVLGQIAGGRRLLEDAVGDLEGTACRLELARALLALGGALRRANRRSEARARLRRALDLATRCDAGPLVNEADAELRACGARPRRALLTGPDSLTASERRVAELAARGLSNPEIARALVVSRATVESHLRAAYRKLDIDSRAALAAVLGDPAPAP